MDLSQNKKKIKLETGHQKNLKFILSLANEEFEEWVATLPDPALEYLEWLIDETEHALDEIAMDASGLEEAQRVIQKYTLSKPD
jgi:hypothetical protein